MTLAKAIELLKIASHGWPVGNNEDYYAALDLGFEALKDIGHCKIVGILPPDYLLSGETEE